MRWLPAAMTKSPGISILAIALVAVAGTFLYTRRGGDDSRTAEGSARARRVAADDHSDTADGSIRIQLEGPPQTSNPDGTFRLAKACAVTAMNDRR